MICFNKQQINVKEKWVSESNRMQYKKLTNILLKMFPDTMVQEGLFLYKSIKTSMTFKISKNIYNIYL